MREKRVIVLAAVTDIHDTCIAYPSCASCYSKQLIDPTSGRYHCIRCAKTCDRKQVQWRYRLVVSVADGLSVGRVVVFGTTLDGFFGKTATDFTRSVDDLERSGYPAASMLSEALLRTFHGKYFYFGFKVSVPVLEGTPYLHHVIKAETSLCQSQLDCTSNFENSHTLAYQMLACSDAVYATVSDHMRLLVKQLRRHNQSTYCTNVSCETTCNSSVLKANFDKSQSCLNQTSGKSVGNSTCFDSDLESVRFSFEKSGNMSCSDLQSASSGGPVCHSTKSVENSLRNVRYSSPTCFEQTSFEKEEFLANGDDLSNLSQLCTDDFEIDSIRSNPDTMTIAANRYAHSIITQNFCLDQPNTYSQISQLHTSVNGAFAQMPVTQKLNFSCLNDSGFTNTSKRIDKELLKREMIFSQHMLFKQPKLTQVQTNCLGSFQSHCPLRNESLQTSRNQSHDVIHEPCHSDKNVKRTNKTKEVQKEVAQHVNQNEVMNDLQMPESEDLDAFFDSQFEGIEFTQDVCQTDGLLESENDNANMTEKERNSSEVRESSATSSRQVKETSLDFESHKIIDAGLELDMPESEALDKFFESFDQFSEEDINVMSADPQTHAVRSTEIYINVEEGDRKCIENSLIQRKDISEIKGSFLKDKENIRKCQTQIGQNELQIDVEVETENKGTSFTQFATVKDNICTITNVDKIIDDVKEKENSELLNLEMENINKIEILQTKVGFTFKNLSEVPEQNFADNSHDDDDDNDDDELDQFFADIPDSGDSKQKGNNDIILSGNGVTCSVKDKQNKESVNVQMAQKTYLTENSDLEQFLHEISMEDKENEIKLMEVAKRNTVVNQTKIREMSEARSAKDHGNSNSSVLLSDIADSFFVDNLSGEELDKSTDDCNIITDSQPTNSKVKKRKLMFRSAASLSALKTNYLNKSCVKQESVELNVENSSSLIGPPQDNVNEIAVNFVDTGDNDNLREQIDSCIESNLFNGSLDLFGSSQSEDYETGITTTPSYSSEVKHNDSGWNDTDLTNPLGTSTPGMDDCLISDSIDDLIIDDSELENEVLEIPVGRKKVKFDKKLRRISSCYIMDVRMKLNESPLKRVQSMPKSCLKLTKLLNVKKSKTIATKEIMEQSSPGLVIIEKSVNMQEDLDMCCNNRTNKHLQTFDGSSDLFGSFCDEENNQSIKVPNRTENSSPTFNKNIDCTRINTDHDEANCSRTLGTYSQDLWPNESLNSAELHDAGILESEDLVSGSSCAAVENISVTKSKSNPLNKENHSDSLLTTANYEKQKSRSEPKQVLQCSENFEASATTPDLFNSPSPKSYPPCTSFNPTTNIGEISTRIALKSLALNTPDCTTKNVSRQTKPAPKLPVQPLVSSMSLNQNGDNTFKSLRKNIFAEDSPDLFADSQTFNEMDYNICDRNVEIVPNKSGVLCKKLFF